MRRNLLVVALALALVAGAPPAHAATARKPTALMLGDSVLAAFGFSYGKSGLAAVASGYTVQLEARSCRRLASPGCLPTAKASALDVLKANRGRRIDVLVVVAGYNDGDIAGGVQAVMKEAATQKVGRVVWLTYRNPSKTSRLTKANGQLWDAKRKWPQLVVADWDGVSAGKSSWFTDGVHLTPAGAKAMGTFIKAVADQRARRTT
jgi:lysophospholipase L1-like esterase